MAKSLPVLMIAATIAAPRLASAQTIASVYNDAVSRYCKTAAPAACTFYRGHAGYCIQEAGASIGIYSSVSAFEREGLSPGQAAQMATEGAVGGAVPTGISADDAADIAQAAAQVIDSMTQTARLEAQHPGQIAPLPPTFPTTADAFARDVVLRTCLDNLAQE
ncbi:MAG: hypothetical protein ACREEA_00015 [Stellaceae bacterium]